MSLLSAKNSKVVNQEISKEKSLLREKREGVAHIYSPFGPYPDEEGRASRSRGRPRTSTNSVEDEQKRSSSRDFLKRQPRNKCTLSSSTRQAPPKPRPRKPVANVFAERAAPKSEFRRFYERGDLPVSIQHVSKEKMNLITWALDIEKLDFHHYLPIFFDGIREREEPYRTLAIRVIFKAFLLLNFTYF